MCIFALNNKQTVMTVDTVNIKILNAEVKAMFEEDMKEVASIIDFVLKNTKPGVTKEGKPAKGKIVISDETKALARERVNKLLKAHVLYPELDLDFLKKEFVK